MDLSSFEIDVDPNKIVTRSFSAQEIKPIVEALDKQFMQLIHLHFAGTNADADTTYTFAMSVLIVWICAIFMEDEESALANAKLFASQLIEKVHTQLHETSRSQ